MARKREELGDPPTPEELLAWRDGRLDPAAREHLAARIAIYPDAARALADLAAFPDVEPGPDTPEPPDEDAGWQAFRTRLAQLPPPAAPLPAPAPHRPLPWRLPAAAALLLSAGLLAGYLAGRGSRTAPERAVGLNVTIAELAPVEDDGVRASDAPVELPPVSDELLLILTLPATEEFATYEVEISGREGTRLWSGGGLQPTPLGTVQLSFPRETFAPGVYQIDLLGVDGAGRKARVARYELRVALTQVP